eukprot:SAG31_NODE_35960_length_318_cov_0.488584_1_plen_73_part_01
MPGLVKYGHSKGLKVGWYENGCACGERKALDINYEGDVRQLHALDFDGARHGSAECMQSETHPLEQLVVAGVK